MTISANAEKLEPAAACPYLCHTVEFNNSNWAVLQRNLQKAWCWWGMVAKVLTRTGVTVQAQSMLYKAVVKTVLLYRTESWMVMRTMLKVMERIHHWVGRGILGKTA